MNNILLLTDFTETSYNAHKYAFEMYKGQQCAFYILSIQKIWEYTMDDLMMSSPNQDINTALLGDNRSKLNTIKDIYAKDYVLENFHFNTVADYDVFTDAINEAVNSFDIQLIVSGTNGKSDLIEKIFSSHTLRIIRKVDCPVLIIPEDTDFEKLIRIQYLLDYDDVFEMCGKEPLIKLVRNYQSTIDVLRLYFGYNSDQLDNDQEYQEINNLFPSNEVDYQTYADKNPVQVIKEHLINKPAQLQVLSAHRQTFLERIFSNSHLSQIVNSATIPLLILRDCNS